MITTSTHRAFAFATITLLTLLVVVILNTRTHKIDCNDPAVWGTQLGVQSCAVHGGK